MPFECEDTEVGPKGLRQESKWWIAHKIDESWDLSVLVWRFYNCSAPAK